MYYSNLYERCNSCQACLCLFPVDGRLNGSMHNCEGGRGQIRFTRRAVIGQLRFKPYALIGYVLGTLLAVYGILQLGSKS